MKHIVGRTLLAASALAFLVSCAGTPPDSLSGHPARPDAASAAEWPMPDLFGGSAVIADPMGHPPDSSPPTDAGGEYPGHHNHGSGDAAPASQPASAPEMHGGHRP